MLNLRELTYSLDFLTMMLCALGIITVVLVKRIQKNYVMQFVPIFLFTLLTALCNLVGEILDGAAVPAAIFIKPFFTYGEFASTILTAVFFLMYLIMLMERDGHVVRYKKLLYGPHVLYLLLLAFNIFHPVFFCNDAGNVYHRLPMYNILMFLGVGVMFEDFLLFMTHIDRLTHRERIAFQIYFILPVIGLVIQMFEYGAYTLLLSETIALTLMFELIIQDQLDQYIQKESEVKDMRTKVMISQIQPHFIFNALTAISELCHDKAPEAEEAINKFSRYLRGNIDYLSSEDRIPFSKELDHIRNYLELEKMRFGDKIKVVYDIQEEDFRIPPLSLQPLVENAIKHGITKKRGGGTLLIRSVREGAAYVVTIKDDGVGFNPEQENKDPKIHVGLANSKERLQTLMNADMKIESTPGEGTVITIAIPAETKEVRA